MSNQSKGRVLPDLSPENKALLQRLLNGEDVISTLAQGDTKTPTVTLGEYQGAAMLQFSGPFKPFNISVNKANRLFELEDITRPLIKQANEAKAKAAKK